MTAAVQITRFKSDIAQPIYDIVDKIEMPSGGKEIYIPKFKGEAPREFRDYNYQGYVARLNRWQTGLLAQEVSKRVGSIFIHFPVQDAYSEFYSNESFKKFMWRYWIHNAEVIIQKGAVMPNPKVEEKGRKLVFTGEKVKVEIKKTAIDTLAAAGLFKKGKHKVWKGEIDFENGLSSVRSGWGRLWGCFYAGSGWPGGGGGDDLAAFKLVEPKNEAKQQNKREVAETEYQELLGKAERLEVLEKDLQLLKKYF